MAKPLLRPPAISALMKYRKDNFKGMCVYKVQKTGAWRQLQLERPEEARVLKGTEHGNFVYNVQLVDFQNGNYSTHKINPFAWKAFGLPWPMYIKELVLPAEIPVRQFDLRKYFTGFRTRQRLYYLLFNIVNTCLTLTPPLVLVGEAFLLARASGCTGVFIIPKYEHTWWYQIVVGSNSGWRISHQMLHIIRVGQKLI